MLGLTIRGLLVAFCVLVAGTAVVRASESRDGSQGTGDGGGAITETEAQTEARLVGGASQTSAVGYAESTVITITDTTTNTTKTSSSLSVSVKKLTLADGAVVTFQLNTTTVGTGTVKHGRASLRLSSRNGGTVPAVAAGDTLNVLDPAGSAIDLTGTFGPITTQSGN